MITSHRILIVPGADALKRLDAETATELNSLLPDILDNFGKVNLVWQRKA